MTATGSTVFEGDFWRDPYPAYAQLRSDAPVVEVPLPSGGSTWLVTRYDDVRAAFTDERLVKDVTKVLAQQADLVEIVHTLRPIVTVKGDSKAKED